MSLFIRTRISLIFTTVILLIFAHDAAAQKNSPKREIEQIVNSAKAEIGVAVLGLEDNFSLTVNQNKRFPMQSVFKFPLAIAVLDQVDKGKLSLDQKISVTKKDLLPDTWSPLREAYPEGAEIPLRDLLAYTVSQSDNNGCDILFRLLGGTKTVEAYVHKIGVKDIAIAATEEEMAKDWNVQFTNWNKPLSMAHLLKDFYAGKFLSRTSRDFLWKIMVETSTGAKRIKGLLTPDTIVAHKTGTSGTNEQGITAATNDVGIVALPDGRHFAIVVYVADSRENTEAREAIIARITKIIWDNLARKT